MDFEVAPFLIRSHHLQKLLEVKKQNYDMRGFLHSLVCAVIVRRGEIVRPGLTYGEDVKGKNKAGRQKFEAGVTKYIDSYKKLQPDAPIKIGSFLDGICMACVIGEHCKLSLNNTDYNYGEGYAVDKFIDLARRLKILDRIQVFDPSEGSIRTIITTKGVVEQIISEAAERREHFIPKS